MRRHRNALPSLALVILCLGGPAASAAVLRYDLASLARRSSLILTGEVVEMESFRAEYPGIGEVILTDVRVRVERMVKGETEDEEVTVRVLGGRIGTTFQVCPESARYEKGEKVLVFLREHDGALWNAGWFQGKYRVLDDGGTVEGRKGLPLAENAALSDLETRLRALWESSGGEPAPSSASAGSAAEGSAAPGSATEGSAAEGDAAGVDSPASRELDR